MVCDLAVGYETDGQFFGVMEVRGLWLKQKKDGSANYVNFPSKERKNRDGEPVLDENGYKVYDNIVDLYMEREGEKKGPTQAGWGFRKWLIEEMTKSYNELGKAEAGRGAPKAAEAKSAPPAKPTKPALATTRVADEFPDESDDDGYPF